MVENEVVTRARFERATSSFGGWRSIQLSYRATYNQTRNKMNSIVFV
jgi:hypothetical protein